MSTMRKGTKYVALLAGSALALSACNTADSGGGGTDGAAPVEGGDAVDTGPITYAWEQEFGSYNNNTADENAIKNTVVLNQVLGGFWYFNPDGTLARDETFGTFEQTSEEPLTVEYTFADDAVWSDGEPIDCDDFLLAWAANSGAYTTGEVDAEGNEALVFSTSGTTGYELMEKPVCEDGDKTIEVVYTEPFADWEAMFGGGTIMPAHIVEQQSGVEDLIAAISGDDMAQLTAAAEFYNTGWVFNPGQLNPEITPSSGPYMLDSWQAGQSLTLTANPEWWGDPAATSTIVSRFITQDAQAQALQNGEVQIIAPQPNPELVAQLEALGDQVEVATGDDYTYEHYDFNFTGPFADRALREAFALCVPRQTIVDNLIKSQNPEATVQNSRYIFPFQDEYQEVADAVVGDTYAEPDIDRARQLLEEAGAVGTQVRIGYQTPNPRRSDQVSLLRDSCNQAGFDIIDAGQEDFFGNGLANGNFDVAMFAWSGSPLVSGSSSTFITGGGNNNGKYSNPEVDALTAELNVTPDPAEQLELIKQIETILWEDLATIPVFAFPSITAWDANVENVVPNSTSAQVTWNKHEWMTTPQ